MTQKMHIVPNNSYQNMCHFVNEIKKKNPRPPKHNLCSILMLQTKNICISPQNIFILLISKRDFSLYEQSSVMNIPSIIPAHKQSVDLIAA